jgi:endonuclease G
VRGLTRQFDDVYVVSGPLFLPKFDAAEGKHFVKYEVLGDPPNTAVPTHFFKVILAVKGDMNALGGFVVPNEVIVDEPLTGFVVPIEGTLSYRQGAV